MAAIHNGSPHGLTRIAPDGRWCDHERPLVNAGRWATKLQLFQKAIVIGMASDPKPCDPFLLQESYGTVRDGHAHGYRPVLGRGPS